MKRFVWLTLIVAVVAGYSASQTFARGGGGHGGGGHHGGGHHGSHHSSHHHSGHHHHNNHDHHAHSHVVSHYGHHRPFSNGWYGNHAGAWGWGGGGYGWGNPWAAAGIGAVGTWLGMSALNNGYGYPANNSTVYTSDNGGDNYDVADQSTQPSTDDENAETVFPAAEAAQLAANGANDPAADAKFMPLGVYSIAPEGQEEASAMLHLAVSKDGVLRGSYYDLLTDKDHDIKGAVDKKTGRVAWTVAPNGKVVFHTSLKDLTEDSGPVAVNFENGETREWTIARYIADDDEKSTTSESTTGAQEESSGAPQPSKSE